MRFRFFLIPFVTVAVSACSHMPNIDLPMGQAPSAVETVTGNAEHPDASPETEAKTPLHRAIKFLDAGNAPDARAELAMVLADSPSNKSALSLLRQIETDPIELLGEANELYVVQAGDTLSALAGRHLGDPLLFYALSRYNGLRSPQALEVGKTLLMPAARAASGESNSSKKAPAAPVGAAAPKVLTAAQTEEAKALRRRGLEALNAGQTDVAVQMLEAAYKIDGANELLANDLSRAKTIQQAVKRP